MNDGESNRVSAPPPAPLPGSAVISRLASIGFSLP